MMRLRLASLALVASLSPALAVAETKAADAQVADAKPTASKPAAAKPPLKPMATQPNTADTIKKVPPFLGLFGTEEMIAKYGFRSRPGTFAEFDAEPNARNVGTDHSFRLAEVGPSVPGARWIEMVSITQSIGSQGIRLLTRGEKNGNLERLVGRAGGLPPMEFPLDNLTIEAIGGGTKGLTDMTLPAKIVGQEVVTTPLGKFKADHWIIDVGPKHRLEFWFTTDEKIPFTGLVKMINDEGTVIVNKVGTNMTESIPVPPRL